MKDQPITFPKTGDGEWTNRETGVRISKHYEGHYRILAGNLPPSPSRAVGLHAAYWSFSQVLAAAKGYVAEVARPAIAAAHTEALEEDAQRDLDRERAASDERIRAGLREARLGREGLDRQYTRAGAVAANRALTEAHEEALEMNAEHDKAMAYLNRLAADLRRAGLEVPAYAPYRDRALREAHLAMVNRALRESHLAMLNRAHGEALRLDLATRGGAFNVGDVVTVSPLGGRQFEVVELDWDPTPTSLLVRVSPLNPTGLEDGLRWVSATYVRRVPTDQTEPGPDQREADEQRLAWIGRHRLKWNGINNLSHTLFEYHAAVAADHAEALREDAAREQAGPRFPEGTPEYAAYRAELKTELGKFARGEAPYEYDREAVSGRARLYPGPF